MVIEIIILAAVAGFLFLRLRDALGKKTGHENPADWFGNSQGAGTDQQGPTETVVPFPGAEQMPAGRDHEDVAAVTDIDGPIGQTLIAAKELEPEFDAKRYLEGARMAYEMILMAFETGDKETLKPLLADDVYESFAAAIDARREQNLSVDARFVGLRSAEIEAARLDRHSGEIEIDTRFRAEMIVAVRNADGEIVEGDPAVVRGMNDLWSFRRVLGSNDPSWLLTATDE